MATQPSQDDGRNGLVLEVQGELTEDDIEHILEQLNIRGGVNRFRIEINADHPVYHPMVDVNGQQQSPEDTTSDPEIQQTAQEVESEPEQAQSIAEDTESAEEDEKTEQPTETQDDIPTLQAGGDPFFIMQTLYEVTDWVMKEDLKDEIPAETNVNLDTVGQTLWSLHDRGLVEKRPYEEDRRRSEYRSNEVGQEAVEETVQRIEQNEGDDTGKQEQAVAGE